MGELPWLVEGSPLENIVQEARIDSNDTKTTNYSSTSTIPWNIQPIYQRKRN
jgi:hypothetical protein